MRRSDFLDQKNDGLMVVLWMDNGFMVVLWCFYGWMMIMMDNENDNDG